MASADGNSSQNGNRKIENLRQKLQELAKVVKQQEGGKNLQKDWEYDLVDPMERTMMHLDGDIGHHRGRGHPKQGNKQRGNFRGRGNLRANSWRGQRNWRSGNRSSREEGNFGHANDWAPTRGHPSHNYSSNQYSYSRPYSPDNWRKRPSPRNSYNYYDESEQESPRSPSGVTSAGQKSDLSPNELAKRLVPFSDMEATLLSLIEKFDYDLRQLRKVIAANPNVFETDRETVRLRPKIGLCDDHKDTEGCQSMSNCQELHLCQSFVTKTCKEKDSDCLLGHDFFTNHNKRVLKAFHLDLLSKMQVSKLLNSPLGDGGALRVCEEYNGDGCHKENCAEAHLCLKNLAKRCVSTGECELNHGVSGVQVTSILGRHGISTNESPRDILRLVTSCPQVKGQIDALKSKLGPSGTEGDTGKKDVATPKDDQTKSVKNDTAADQSGSTSESSKAPLKTVWAQEFKGEVTLNEICYDSVEGFCPYEASGCWRLHSSLHFCWQVRSSSSKKCFWANLTKDQIIALEKAYCIPEVEKVELPPLDTSSLGYQRGLIMLLNGRSKWEANFDTMQLTLIGQKEVLDLRRLCTQNTTDHTLPKPCVFRWFFIDKNQKWIEYGQVDSTGEEKLKCSANSKSIETHYQANPTTALQFQSQAFRYSLDFVKMCQTNLQTNVVRKVRRRPCPHLKDEASSEAKGNLPSFWESMQPEERVRRVVLAHSSEEYQKVTSLIQARQGSLNLLKVERVQNPYLWKAFQNKVEEMTSLYKNKAIVDVQQLFHGTKPDVVPKICQENFDWRMHGSNVGQAFGRGTYFSPLPSTSHGYTSPDAQGNRFMFIAQVAVGTTTLGNSNMPRPPIHPTYNVPYDSTVNQTQNPSIIVKYDKQEYFPEYILTFT